MEADIRSWFLSQDERDNDFFVAPPNYTFSVIAPVFGTETVFYCPKSHSLLKLAQDYGSQLPFSAVMRGGLPSKEDVTWLASFAETRRLIFFGDADPTDLLIFALLRTSLSIEYGGLTDRLLKSCGVAFQDCLTISLDEAESAAMPLLSRCLGDVDSHVGPWCSSLLLSGRKIEVEALFSFATVTPSAIVDALLAGEQLA